jgi:4-diphosphocytidyl-2C-methyl-D-erythritol kinase
MALQNAGATYACVFLAKALAAGGGIGGGGCDAARSRARCCLA